MARLNVFVVSFICFVRGAMLKRAPTKEHFGRLPYSMALLAERDLLLALLLRQPAGQAPRSYSDRLRRTVKRFN
jgi:hypothetical protein